jgi:hypothetical protein
VQGPLKRTPLQASGGAAAPANDCSGSFAYDFGARIASGVDPSLVCDADVYSQFWFRDPQDPQGFGTALSSALKFTIQP